MARIALGDGAMGTELIARGLRADDCLPEANLSRPDLVRSLHRAYAEAGVQVHRTNTFTANRLRLAPYGLDRHVREINAAGVRLAREAAGREGQVWGSLGPLTGLRACREERQRSYMEQVSVFAEAGCDTVALETFPEAAELVFAIRLAVGFGVTVAAFLVVGEDLKCRDGVDATAAARRAVEAGAFWVGVNCTPPAVAVRALRAMADAEGGGLAAFPSAGPPGRVEDPEGFARAASELGSAGAGVLGGCCGAGPEHIRALAATLRRPRPSG